MKLYNSRRQNCMFLVLIRHFEKKIQLKQLKRPLLPAEQILLPESHNTSSLYIVRIENAIEFECDQKMCILMLHSNLCVDVFYNEAKAIKIRQNQIIVQYMVQRIAYDISFAYSFYFYAIHSIQIFSTHIFFPTCNSTRYIFFSACFFFISYFGFLS